MIFDSLLVSISALKALQVKALYIRPEFTCRKPVFFDTLVATLLFPDAAGPSIAITLLEGAIMY